MSVISVVIVAYNEAEKLESCLVSVANFADEILVIDLGSTDTTAAVAKKYHAQVIAHQHVDIVEKVRNYSISLAKGDWILLLDPDECVTKDLKQHLRSLTSQTPVAYNIPRKNIIFGKWIRYSNFWPDFQIRFFKKNFVTWSEEIHTYPSVKGELVNLPSIEKFAFVHTPYNSIEEFISRMNRYTSHQQKYSNPFVDFFKRYIWHAGFMDGAHGIVLSYLMVIYQLCVWIKRWEKKN